MEERSMETMKAILSKRDAKEIVLRMAITRLERLDFDAPDISRIDQKLLEEARDKLIKPLQENLTFIIRQNGEEK